MYKYLAVIFSEDDLGHQLSSENFYLKHSFSEQDKNVILDILKKRHIALGEVRRLLIIRNADVIHSFGANDL